MLWIFWTERSTNQKLGQIRLILYVRNFMTDTAAIKEEFLQIAVMNYASGEPIQKQLVKLIQKQARRLDSGLLKLEIGLLLVTVSFIITGVLCELCREGRLDNNMILKIFSVTSLTSKISCNNTQQNFDQLVSSTDSIIQMTNGRRNLHNAKFNHKNPRK